MEEQDIHEVKKDGSVEMGTVYDMNKQAYAALPALSNRDLQLRLDDVSLWMCGKKYAMILCKDTSYYTILNMKSEKYQNAANDLKECLQGQGTILDIRHQPEQDTWECWVKISGEAYCYMLFDGEGFVVES